MKTYTILVTRTVTETYSEEVAVKADDADAAMCQASDRLTNIIASGKCDPNYDEADDHEILKINGVGIPNAK